MNKYMKYEEWKAEQLKDPEFREAAERLEPAYEVARLRLLRGITQKELAKQVGTRQSSIARLESGKNEPNTSFLRRIAKALRAKLIIKLVPEEDLVVKKIPKSIDVEVFVYTFPSRKIDTNYPYSPVYKNYKVNLFNNLYTVDSHFDRIKV
jgi:transcriptional regulator with XRE-family HTH domain